jgi:GDP-4-dehydro-6-deoxy-D-mannose reductase
MPAGIERIFITGASGFVGTHLVPAVRAAFADAELILPRLDLQDADQVDTAIRTARPDVCIHLAAVSAIHTAQTDPGHAWQVNFHGTMHLAWALMHHAPSCQLLFVSSADAYGESFRSGEALTEAAPLDPKNVYGHTKAAADFALGGMAAQGLRVVRLRAFNHTGPGQSADFVIPAFARQIARIAAGLQKPLMEVGNLDTRRDFLDVRDVCNAYVACVTQRDKLVGGTILNIASGHARRVGDVLNELATIAGVTVDIRVDPARVRGSDIPVACGISSRACELLGWAPSVSWTQTLRDVLDYWRERVRTEQK